MTPTPDQVRASRAAAGLTQAQAAALVRVTPRAWQAWERGQNPMPPTAWLLWRLLVGETSLAAARGKLATPAPRAERV